MSTPYVPVSCGLYDRLEAAATRRAPVALAAIGDDGTVSTATVRIVDLVSADAAEHAVVQTADGATARVRLDRIVSLDGAP